jgi:hypothetical protein
MNNQEKLNNMLVDWLRQVVAEEELNQSLVLLENRINKTDPKLISRLLRNLSDLVIVNNAAEKWAITKAIYEQDTLPLLLEMSGFPEDTIFKLLNKIAGIEVVFQAEKN